jgi:plastocyanin
MNVKNNGTETENQNPTFSVMPKVEGPMTQAAAPAANPTPTPPQPNTKPLAHPLDGISKSSDEPKKNSKWLYWLIGILVIAGLGGLAYYLLGPNSGNDTNEPASKLPKVFLQQHFSVDLCLDKLLCGDDADPDKDGLSNYNEFVEQTDPRQPDTDGDGLADGDELNVFLTNPILKFTDPRPITAENNYTDGSQISNQYDPLTPGLKMSESRINAIEAAKKQYGLHEPSITTLGTLGVSVSTPAAQTVTVFIANGRFDPSNITIRTNDTVVWLNKDSIARQISSDPHPDHSDLPDLASGTLGVSQTYSYKFTQSGTFKYHEESLPTSTGSVIVTE